MEPILEFQGKYRFLSNFWHAEVVLDGIQFPTVEHAFQAAKTTDELHRSLIAQALTPGQAKRMGKKLVLRDNWEELKIPLMHWLLTQKFSSDPLRSQLLDTGIAPLIEGNTWGDTFWGVCNGRGENWLGKILMLVRRRILLEDL